MLLILNMFGFILARYYGGYGRTSTRPMTDEERHWLIFFVSFFILGLLSWGCIVLTRYFFREQMIRKKMSWSSSKDAFWDYDTVLEVAKSNYTKAQILLTTHPEALKKLSPYERARLRLLTKNITSPAEITFKSAYIVCFDDKKNDSQDSVAVYLEFTVRKKYRFKEILVMHREGESWKITDYVQNPSMFMISHARSIIEKS